MFRFRSFSIHTWNIINVTTINEQMTILIITYWRKYASYWHTGAHISPKATFVYLYIYTYSIYRFVMWCCRKFHIKIQCICSCVCVFVCLVNLIEKNCFVCLWVVCVCVIRLLPMVVSMFSYIQFPFFFVFICIFTWAYKKRTHKTVECKRTMIKEKKIG